MAVANRENPLVPNFEIIINGSPLPVEAKLHIQSVIVDHEVNIPGMFSLELTGSDSQDDQTTWLNDETLFVVGNVVEIQLGYEDELETLIIGEITGLEAEFSFDRLPSLVVRGYDRLHHLQRGRKTQTFSQQTDSQIASTIAQGAGLTAQVEDSQVVHNYVLQREQTDLAFLQQRAKTIHYEVKVEDKTLLFEPVAHTDNESITLSFVDDLISFSPRLSSIRPVSELNVRGWNVKEKQAIVAQTTVGAEGATMGGETSGPALVEESFNAVSSTMSYHPILSQAEADQMAQAHYQRLALTLIEAEGSCWGRTDLRVSQVIKLEGIGSRFSGQYYVTATVHHYQAQSGYRTYFTVQRNSA